MGPSPRDDPEAQARIAAFLQGLQQLGWAVGRNVRVDIRWAAGNAEGQSQIAAELVALASDVIVANGSMSMVRRFYRRPVACRSCLWSSPTRLAPATSIAWRGRGETPPDLGVLNTAWAAKWLELLKQVQPSVTRVGCHPRSRHNRGGRPVRRGPVRGTISRGGGEPNQRARCARDRARHRGIRALLEWRPCRDCRAH